MLANLLSTDNHLVDDAAFVAVELLGKPLDSVSVLMMDLRVFAVEEALLECQDHFGILVVWRSSLVSIGLALFCSNVLNEN
jgi:hypothetical protein